MGAMKETQRLAIIEGQRKRRQREKTMSDKGMVEVTAIWTRRIGAHVETLVEVGGTWRLVSRDFLDSNFSHIAEANGIKNWPPERDSQVPSCGYFRGETAPAGCKVLMRKYRAAIRVATDAQMLANTVAKSLDAGPLSKDPSREAGQWRALRESLRQFREAFDVG